MNKIVLLISIRANDWTAERAEKRYAFFCNLQFHTRPVTVHPVTMGEPVLMSILIFSCACAGTGFSD